MDLRVGGRTFGAGEFVIMSFLITGDSSSAAGADIVEVTADPGAVAGVRAARPALPVAVAPDSVERAVACAGAGADLLVGDAFAGVAASTGTALLCSAPERAVGVRPDGVLVRAANPREAERLTLAGHAVLVDEPELAVMSVYAWLGARIFRVADVAAARQALDMVASIRGIRPPAVARRGLA